MIALENSLMLIFWHQTFFIDALMAFCIGFCICTIICRASNEVSRTCVQRHYQCCLLSHNLNASFDSASAMSAGKLLYSEMVQRKNECLYNWE